MMDSLIPTVQQITIWAIPVIFAITAHETAHGWVALKFGDRTAQMLGRLTLNPVKHIDPIGTILVPVVALAMTGYAVGWAKPVPVTIQNLNNPKTDMLWVALAGPASNFLMALLWSSILILVVRFDPIPYLQEPLTLMSEAGIIINLLLMILNMLPILPLDGGRILANLLPDKLSWLYMQTEPYGIIVVLVLFASGLLMQIIGPLMQISIDFINYLFGFL